MQIRHNSQALEAALQAIIERHLAKTAALAAAAVAATPPPKPDSPAPGNGMAAPVRSITAASSNNWLARAAAIALVILAIAIAIRILNTSRDTIVAPNDQLPPRSTILPKPGEQPSAKTSTTKPQADDTNPSYVTTNFTIFKNTTDFAAGKTWEITAGHAFATQEDQAKGEWQSAWCYVKAMKGKLAAQISLGNRDTIASMQTAPDFDVGFVQSLGLSGLDIQSMAKKCPWLDGKAFDVTVSPFADSPDVSAKSNLDAGSPSSQAQIVSGAPVAPIPPADSSSVNSSGTETIGNDATALAISQRLLRLENFDAPGGDLPNMPLMNMTKENCESSCQSNSACNVATFNSKSNACFLKAAAGKLSPFNGATTFYRPDLTNRMIELSQAN